MIVNRKSFTVILLELNKPNKNGRIYRKESFNPPVEGKEILGYLGQTEIWQQHIDRAAFMVKNIHFEDDKLIGDIHPLSTPMGDLLQQVLKHVTYRTMGYAKTMQVDEHTEITDIHLVGIIALPHEQAA